MIDHSISVPNLINTQNNIGKWMTQNPIVLTKQQTIQEAITLFSYYKFYGMPVVDEHNHLEGMVTKTSIMNALFNKQDSSLPVSHIMEVELDVVFPLDPLEKATGIKEGCLPVIKEDQTLVGIITRTDLLKAKSIEFDTVKSSLDYIGILQQALNSAYGGMVIVDHQGLIIEINDAYCQILGKKREEVLHKPVQQVIENTHLHLTCQTGEEERNRIQRINGKEMIVHRIPLKKETHIIGALGMLIFKSIDEMYTLAEKTFFPKKTTESQTQEKQAYFLKSIIGQSLQTQKTKEQLVKIAALPSTVLITGESGTGKEVYARAIHNLSNFGTGPFVPVNCSAIPESLLESELFGYEPGAFTGASQTGKKGKFELAENGTIFLDEIGDMPLLMQAKLLRVLQEKVIEPVGATTSKKIHLRVIAATNQNLPHLIQENKFREDLFYRLNVLALKLDPLREKTEDIPDLVTYFLKKFSTEFQLPIKSLAPEALDKLLHYSWPGNIRELENICEAMVGLSSHLQIGLADLPSQLFTDITEDLPITNDTTDSLEHHMQRVEKAIIQQTLAMCDGNKKQCAKLLGIQRSTLYKKLANYQIN
ncbi:sigma-54-dependent Fis family transcriptional regulator [Vagococcus humatus]|uniref:Sigma-54-dependent Fis family transcriptional regulator n=1 Tax=Vagococcus humatus TaxID=1889241 RepID=A0A429Z4E6_9ENTE|nr:sigma-54-dependent Fis family transcriptional regulator [Vagococcus humatus]RST88550.1 sigma-54-dependent Fis family transcriptional regulator [Vagococcus humatus]